MTTKLIPSMLVCSIVFGFASIGSAHESFQDVLKSQYMLKSFSCKNCHPDSDDRKIRTPFAERIYQQLKEKGLSEKFALAVKKDEEALKADPNSVGKDKGPIVEFEKMAAKDFKEAFKEVAKQKISFDELIKSGMFSGARLDKKAIEAAKSK